MDTQNVDLFLFSKNNFFKASHIPLLREMLLTIPEENWFYINSVQLHDPNMLIIASVFGGALGIDRFIIGDIGLGIGKLLTLGGCGIWKIIDLFLIMDATRQKNFEKVSAFLGSITPTF